MTVSKTYFEITLYMTCELKTNTFSQCYLKKKKNENYPIDGRMKSKTER